MRKRQQSGYIYQRGGWWVLRYRENVYEGDKLVRRQMAKQLEPVRPEHARLKRPPPEVERMAADFLLPFNRQSNPDTTRTLGAFVEGYFLPHIQNNRRYATFLSYRSAWKTRLAPHCAQVRLRDLSTYDCELLFQEIARQHPTLCRRTLKVYKALLSSIFKHAKRLKAVADNPVRDTSIPESAREHGDHQTGFYTLQEIRRMLPILPEPAHTAVAIAAFAGLRASEIRGLEWQHYTSAGLSIEQCVSRGVLGPTKSEASHALVPVVGPLKTILDEWRTHSGNPTTGFIFPGRRAKSASMDSLVLQIAGVLPEGMWRGWHAFRRGLATNLHDLGVNDITIQHILRHSDVSVTRASYIRTLPEQTVDAMQQFEDKWKEVSTLVQ